MLGLDPGIDALALHDIGDLVIGSMISTLSGS
jgi:hypothetical protein